MKFSIPALVMMFGGALAQASNGKAAATNECSQVIEATVRSAALSMGIQTPIGFELSDAEGAGEDISGRPLVRYHTSAFMTDEGYIPGSGATTVVRRTDGICELIRLSISISR